MKRGRLWIVGLLLSLLSLQACGPVSITLPDAPIGPACLGGYFVNHSDPRGVRIVELMPGGPLDLARIRINDVIVSINQYSTPTVSDLSLVVRAYRPGDIVVVRHARERLFGLYWDYYNTSVRLGELRGEACILR